MKTLDQIEQELKAPFKSDELEWRVQRCGKSNGKVWAIIVPYVNNRAIMDRLDEVVGFGNWSNDYQEIAGKAEPGLICAISIELPPRHEDDYCNVRTKHDAAPYTTVESIKGGASDSMKRAAVQWGIGRYLYKLGTIFAQDIQDGFPPRDVHAVNIVDKKNGIQAWCPAPDVNVPNTGTNEPKKGTETAQKPSQETAQKPSQTNAINYKEKCDAGIEKLKKFGTVTDTELNEAIFTYLKGEDYDTCPNPHRYKRLLEEFIIKTGVAKKEIVPEVEELEKVAYQVKVAITNARNKYLDGKAPQLATLHDLKEYKAHMEQKLKDKPI